MNNNNTVNFTQPILPIEYSGSTAKGTTTGFWYNDGGAPIFSVLISIRILMSLIGIAGNSMVIHASIKNKNVIGKSFRYLNRVVLSLAVSDLVYSILGQPFDMLYWYYNLSDVGPMLRKTGRTWIMSIVTFPQDVCAGASCYHVALIVFLRCLCLIHPMTFREWHNRLSCISIIGIWTLMIGIVLSPTIISTQMTTKEGKEKNNHHYGNAWNVVDNVTIALPVLLNVIFSCAKVFLLKKRRIAKEADDFISTQKTTTFDSEGKPNSVSSNPASRHSKHKSLERMIQLVAIGTVICYTPDIIFRSYIIEMLRQNKKIYASTGTVLFFFFARLGVQITSIINPFIYATTIPQFKKLAKRNLRYFLRNKNDEPSVQMPLNTADVSTSKTTGNQKK